jgi:predicted metal-dependent enzyme (double-stranded beta helix superfamily)
MLATYKLRNFVVNFTQLIDSDIDEAATLAKGRELVAGLVAEDDWLSEAYAQPNPTYYQQYLLHADPLERLSIVSFVWGPGQKTPIHDHTVWGVVGVLRGAEIGVGYTRKTDGRLEAGPEERLERGQVVAVSPTIGDIHVIANASPIDLDPCLRRQYRRDPAFCVRSGERRTETVHLGLCQRRHSQSVGSLQALKRPERSIQRAALLPSATEKARSTITAASSCCLIRPLRKCRSMVFCSSPTTLSSIGVMRILARLNQCCGTEAGIPISLPQVSA